MPAESVLWGKLMSAIGRGDEQDVAELLKVGPCGLSRATRVRLISPSQELCVAREVESVKSRNASAEPLPSVTLRVSDRPSAS
jgi:hypothetical protein